MHEQIYINDIIIHWSKYQELIPLISKMKSIEVFNDFEFKDSNCSIPLWDKIVSNLTLIRFNKSKIFCFKDYKVNEINSELVEFRRIKRIILEDYTNSLQKLEQIKMASISVDEISIKDNLSKLELLTNPIYYKYRIKKLSYQFSCNHDITDQTFTNIKEIYPNYIHFYDNNRGSLPYFCFIRIISNLPEKIKVLIGRHNQYNKTSLTFSNTFVRIYQNDDEGLLIYSKLLTLYFEDSCINNRFNFNQDSQISNWNNFYIIKAIKISAIILDNFKKINDPKEILEVEKCFPPKSPSSLHTYEIVVPLKNLINVDLPWEIKNKSSKELLDIIPKLSHSKLFKCHIQLNEDFKYLNEWNLIFPEHCQYLISINKIQ